MNSDSSGRRTTMNEAVIFAASGMEAIRSRNFPQTACSGAIFQPRFLNLRTVSIFKPREPDELWEDPLTETQHFLDLPVTALH